jgi:hypothetical protein
MKPFLHVIPDAGLGFTTRFQRASSKDSFDF